MSNVRLLWRDQAQGATLSASSASYGFPVANLATQVLGTPWMSDSLLTTESIVIDLGVDGDAYGVDAFALLGHDLAAGDSGLTLQANSSNSWGSPAYSHACTWRAGTLAEFLPAHQHYRYWRFVFSKGAAGTRQAGRLMLGLSYECPKQPLETGFRWGREDLSVKSRTPDGQSYADRGAILRTLDLQWAKVSDAQAAEFQALGDALGTTGAFLLSGDPENHPADWLLYGTLKTLGGAEYAGYWDNADAWDLALSMGEER